MEAHVSCMHVFYSKFSEFHVNSKVIEEYIKLFKNQISNNRV